MLSVNRNWPAVAAKLSEFFKYCPNDAKLSDITSAHVANYLAGLQARKLNPNSINNYLAQVSALLNSAARHFPAAKFNPPTIPRLAPALTTDRVLTGPELQTIYRALTKAGKVYDSETPSVETRRREFIADLFLACALTGARPSEILSLTWPQISFAFSTLTLHSQKTNDRRTMPLTSGLAALFKRRQPANPAKPFAKVCYSTMTYQLQNFGEAIGITYGEHTGWTLKTLRHTAISTMLRRSLARRRPTRSAPNGADARFWHSPPLPPRVIVAGNKSTNAENNACNYSANVDNANHASSAESEVQAGGNQ